MQNNKYSEQTNFGLVYLYPTGTGKKNVEPIKEVKKTVEKKKKKKKKIKLNKCYECKKKLTIVQQQLTCKCGANFCPKHRLQSQHNCSKINSFDEEKFKQKCGLGGGKFKQIEAL